VSKIHSGVAKIKSLFLVTSKVNYALFLVLRCVVYIFCPNPYIISNIFSASVRNNLSSISGVEDAAVLKTAFLSYYISMYNAVNRQIGYEDAPITVDEIYDFIQDLKHEGGKQVPDISKGDISFCFHLLQISGICKA
jgi:hypothetical protein